MSNLDAKHIMNLLVDQNRKITGIWIKFVTLKIANTKYKAWLLNSIMQFANLWNCILTSFLWH